MVVHFDATLTDLAMLGSWRFEDLGYSDQLPDSRDRSSLVRQEEPLGGVRGPSQTSCGVWGSSLDSSAKHTTTSRWS